MNNDDAWQTELWDVITPYVGAEGLDVGTSDMADAAVGQPEVHEQFVSGIERGLLELDVDEAAVRRVLDSAGIPVQRKQEAAAFLQRLQALYLAKYRERSAAFEARDSET